VAPLSDIISTKSEVPLGRNKDAVADPERLLTLSGDRPQPQRKNNKRIRPQLAPGDTHLSCWTKASVKDPLENWYDGKRRCHRLDVLFGKGGNSVHHQGNILYRNRITQLQPAYRLEECKRRKTMIAWKIVQEISSCGSRFLIKNKPTGLWEEMCNEEARKKVSQALREKRCSKF